MDFEISEVENHNDARGKLFIFLKKDHLPKNSQTFGEIFYITFARKGIVRANHYHKNWQEWFILVSGKVEVVLEDIKTRKRFSTILKSQQGKIVRMRIGPLVAHAFRSLTARACLLNYSTHLWKKKDVYKYTLIS